jgi:Tub family
MMNDPFFNHRSSFSQSTSFKKTLRSIELLSENTSTQSSSTSFILRDPPKKRNSSFAAFFGISSHNEKNKLSTKKEGKKDVTSIFYQPPLVCTIPSIESSHVLCILRKQHGSSRFTFSFQNPFCPNEEWPALMSQVDHHTTYIFDMTGYNEFPNQSICKEDIRCMGTLRQQSVGGNGHASLYNARGFHGVPHQIASIRISGKSRLLPRQANVVLHDEMKVLVAKKPYSKGRTTFGLHFQHGRGKCASKKNCILKDEQKCMVLQMAKVGPETFHVDYRAPLTAYAAFGFALAQMGVA